MYLGPSKNQLEILNLLGGYTNVNNISEIIGNFGIDDDGVRLNIHESNKYNYDSISIYLLANNAVKIHIKDYYGKTLELYYINKCHLNDEIKDCLGLLI